MDEKDLKEIEKNFARHVEQKIREVDAKLSKKIEAIAADLAVHRADTKRHRAGYRVNESMD